MRGLAIRALAALALVVAVLAARVLIGAQREYASASEAERAGELERAIPQYRRAIGWYLPGSPYAERSMAALTGIAARARKAGDLELALTAERAIAAGLASARSFYVPEADALARAEQRIRELTAREGPAPTAPSDPNAALGLLAFVGWLGFVASAFGLVLRGVDAEGRLRDSARYGAGLAAGFVVFALSLWLA